MKFVKMEGAGNDFVLVAAGVDERDWPALARATCDRHYGVGADGLILALPSDVADVQMRMYNPDGSESSMCGNGVRCLARYAVESGVASPTDGKLNIETGAGILTAELLGATNGLQQVRVSMGRPQFAPTSIPMLVQDDGATMGDRVIDFPLTIDGGRLPVTCLSLGNPHAVLISDEPVADFPLEEVGPKIEHHPFFPNRTNFEVATVASRTKIDVRVWERGAGPTLACGSGACAAMIAVRMKGLSEDIVDITLPGGVLTVEWPGRGEVYLTGPAQTVFQGEWQQC